MGGKTSRTKGHSFERDIAKRFRHIFPKAIRQLEYQEGLGVDLANTGKLRIQCKAYKKYVSLSKIEEAMGEEGTIPCLITKGDHKPILIAMTLNDFFKILENPDYVRDEKEVSEERDS